MFSLSEDFSKAWESQFPGKNPPDASFLTAGANRGRTKAVLCDEQQKVSDRINELKWELQQQEFLKDWIDNQIESIDNFKRDIASIKYAGTNGSFAGPRTNATRGTLQQQSSLDDMVSSRPIVVDIDPRRQTFGSTRERPEIHPYETIDDFLPPKRVVTKGNNESRSVVLADRNQERPPSVMGGAEIPVYAMPQKRPKPKLKPKPDTIRRPGGSGIVKIQKKEGVEDERYSTVPDRQCSSFAPRSGGSRIADKSNSPEFKSSTKRGVDELPDPPSPIKNEDSGITYMNLDKYRAEAKVETHLQQVDANTYYEKENPAYDSADVTHKEVMPDGDVLYETVGGVKTPPTVQSSVRFGLQANLDSLGSDVKENDRSESPPLYQGSESDSSNDDSVFPMAHEGLPKKIGLLSADAGDACSIDSTRSAGTGSSLDSISIEFNEANSSSMYSLPVDMRKLVVEGILESDQAYLECLDTLQDYMRVLLASSTTSQPAMSNADYQVIFFGIEELYRLSTEFYNALKERVDNWNESQIVGDLFLESSRRLSIYGEYFNNYGKAMETVYKCRNESEDFQKVTLNIPKPSSKENNVSLEGLLYKPLQRVTKMTLTLADLLKHTPQDSADYKDIEEALKISEDFLYQVNEPAKLKAKYKNKNKRPSKSKKRRKFLKENYIVELPEHNNRKLRAIFLYSDLILCAKQKSSGGVFSGQKGYYQCKWYLPLRNLSLNPNDENAQATPSLPLTSEKEIEVLRSKIAEVKSMIRQEQNLAEKDKKARNAQKSIAKYRKTLMEYEDQMSLISPNLPLRLYDKKEGKTRTLLMASDYERSEWREAIATAKRNDVTINDLVLTEFEIQTLLSKSSKPVKPDDGSPLMKDEEDALTGILRFTVHTAQGFEIPGEYYCCLEVDSYSHFYLIAKTYPSIQGEEPTWHQEFESEIDGAEKLRILCYRKQRGEDQLVGRGTFELTELQKNKEKNVTIDMDKHVTMSISLSYDSLGRQTMKRPKSKRPTGVFGVPINRVTHRERTKIPEIVTICTAEIERRGMSELGIYRISGVNADINKIKKSFENGSKSVRTLVGEADIHAVACVAKLYFRELPEPLFTDNLYNNFVEGLALSDPSAREKCMMSLLYSLPEPNLSTVLHLINHLRRLSEHQSENKMSLHNLATVFGPNLMRPAVRKPDEEIGINASLILEATSFTDVMSQVGVFFYYLEGRPPESPQQTHF
ncbi:active breakpoint cluster region-related protein-like [Saccoglossus kowalevskii]|uniref:Breakpoint cluster region protein-like n=1 Tax=Saccoglossus kowalevskii TaxID=10224 RepID=A0ABM0GRP8_SACKO|nr:PREDICTED: breakpoint cluster region protein-like [Saccoglossus kowalevskii]